MLKKFHLLVCTAVAAMIAACASGFTPAKVVDVASLAECVYANDKLPVPQIVLKCGAQDEQQILDLFAVRKKAFAHAPAACAPSEGGK